MKKYKSVTAVRFTVNIILAVFLLWNDSYLPSPFDSVNLLKEQGAPSKEYIFNFLLRYYNPTEFIILLTIVAFSFILRKYKKVNAAGAAFLLIAVPFLVSSGWQGQKIGKELDEYLETFYEYESTKLMHFKKSKTDEPDFDIIILNVCSLSWDDLDTLNLRDHPFLKQFDYIFTNFNSVASYSNPSAIRLLRANCGQSRHVDLYNNVSKECFLMESLHAHGYETHFLLNHNGQYGNFADEIPRLGNVKNPSLDTANLPIQQGMFDNSPVYDDYSALEKWWAERQKSKSDIAAAYYNTVTLHDGSHWSEEKEWWKRDAVEQYKEFVPDLFNDMTKFFNLLSSSGRNVVVIFVPEHGRAAKGSVIQKSGLRDIPLPDITNIPVGIKLIGNFQYAKQEDRQLIINTPTSYLALSYILSTFIEKNPFKHQGFFSKEFINSIPRTDFVAENEVNIVVKRNNAYFLLGKDRKWLRLPVNSL